MSPALRPTTPLTTPEGPELTLALPAEGSALATPASGEPGPLAALLSERPAARTQTSAARPAVQPAVAQPPVPTQSAAAQIVRFVPEAVWFALAASLALAAFAGVAALLSTRRARRQAGEFAAVSAAALTDQLTGLLNRRGFIDAVERELARARRYGRTFVIAYVDVRGLKRVNDTEGHLAGDAVLREAAALLRDSARADDVVGRIGGDEMGLLLVEPGYDGAEVVIDRISSQVPARKEAIGFRADWDLTIGTAAFPQDGDTVNALLAAADRRLYEQRGIALH